MENIYNENLRRMQKIKYISTFEVVLRDIETEQDH